MIIENHVYNILDLIVPTLTEVFNNFNLQYIVIYVMASMPIVTSFHNINYPHPTKLGQRN